MSIKEFAERLKQFGSEAENQLADIYTAALQNLDAEMENRIFNEHESALGQPLGKYSTVPFYATPKQFINKGAFKALGKGEHHLGQERKTYTQENSYTGKKKKVAYKAGLTDRKSMYLVNGYKELRAIQGLPVGEVNLQYSGELLKSRRLQIDGSTFQIVFANDLNRDKARGYEKKKRLSIFAPSPEEEKMTTEYIAEKVNNMLEKVVA